MAERNPGEALETVEQQLIAMKDLTRRTGAISSLQIKNLQMWFYLLIRFVEPEQLVLGFDFEKRIVLYHGQKKKSKGKVPRNIDNICLKLHTWVQELLGPEYQTVVKIKDKTIYTGKRKAPLPSVGPDATFEKGAEEEIGENEFRGPVGKR